MRPHSPRWLQVFSLAAPATLALFGQLVYDIGRVFWAAKLGPVPIAALGSAELIEWMVLTLSQVAAVGSTVLVARRLAEKRRDDAKRAVFAATWITLGLAGLCVLAGHWGAEAVFRGMGLAPEVVTAAASYLRLWLWTIPLLFLFQLLCGVYLGLADVRPANLTLTLVLVGQTFLAPVFMLGWGGFAARGINGAVIANLLSYSVGFAFLLGHLSWRHRLSLFSFRLSGLAIPCKDLFAIGGPAAATKFSWASIYPFLLAIVARFGVGAVAGINVGHSLEMPPYYLGIGLSAAITTLTARMVGLGGNKPELRSLVYTGIGMATLACVPIAAAYVFFPVGLCSLLTSDTEVIKNASAYVRIVGYFEIFMLWEMVFQGALTGLGRSFRAFVLNFPLTVLRIPLAYYLAVTLRWGVAGVWWSISLTTLAKGLALYLGFRSVVAGKFKCMTMQESIAPDL